MSPLAWSLFLALYLSLLIADLGVFSRNSPVLTVPQALGRTVIWIGVALGFGALVYTVYDQQWLGVNLDAALSGKEALIQYLTGYVLEWSLSVDNIFVIAVIFTYMNIPLQHQYRVLFWGIVGAIVLRGIMIMAGAALIHAFEWTFYVFGAVLLLSAARMLKDDDEFDPADSVLIKLARRVYPITGQLDGSRFFTRVNNQRAATPLFVTALFVGFADAVFAVDSIPAIFAVTQNSFLVFSSNAFAILGLRSLYFAVAGLLLLFKYLKISLVFVLGFIGVKMLLHRHFDISNTLSLLVIVALLTTGILASVWSSKRHRGDGQ